MGLPRFSVTRNQSGKDCRVRYDITITKKHRLRGLTNSWVDFDQWDSIKREAKERGEWKEQSMRINSELIAFKEHCKTLIRIKDYDEYHQEVELYFGRLTKDSDDSTRVGLLSYIQREIDSADMTMKKNTVQGYRVFLRSLMAYRDIERKVVSYNQVQSAFYKNYINFLSVPHDYLVDGKAYVIGGLSMGSIGKHLGMLRKFMKDSRLNNQHSNTFCESKNFIIPSNEVDEIYLTDDELELLWQYRSDDITTQACVDYFLLSAETCLRMVDLMRVTSDDVVDIDGDQTLGFFEQKKTGKLEKPTHKSFVLNERVLGIMARYGGRFPNESLERVIYPKMINTRIKEVSREVGIEKYDQVKCTTARRSYCTNAFLRGVPIPEIRKQSFHSKDSTTMKYIREANPALTRFIDAMNEKGKMPNYIHYE